MPLPILLSTLLGCRVGSTSIDPIDAGDSRPTTTAETTSSDSTDTGPLPVLPSDPVLPSVILQGISQAPPPGVAFGQEFGSNIMFAGDLEGDGAGDLLVSSPGTPKLMQVFDGPFARGTHEASSLAVAEYPGYIGNWSRAGDMNHDGRDDVWMGNWLFHGPLHGAFDETDANAEFVDVTSGISLGNFDADGDGNLDVAWVYGQTAELHYGPFEGIVPGRYSPDYDAAKQEVTSFRGCCGESTPPQHAVAHDLPVPGHVALLLGHELTGHGIYQLFDATGPRGRELTATDAFAGFDRSPLEGAGDYNGDGYTDLWWGAILAGPFSGWIDPFDQLMSIHYTISKVLQDMTGDGIVDFLALDFDVANDVTRWYVVPGGAVGERLDSVDLGGVHIGPDGGDFHIDSSRAQSGDLDGDRRADLVIGHRYSNNHGGEVRIWYAADLFP